MMKEINESDLSEDKRRLLLRGGELCLRIARIRKIRFNSWLWCGSFFLPIVVMLPLLLLSGNVTAAKLTGLSALFFVMIAPGCVAHFKNRAFTKRLDSIDGYYDKMALEEFTQLIADDIVPISVLH